MIGQLVEDYKREYRESSGDFDNRIVGYGLIGLTILAVNAIVVTLGQDALGLSDSVVFLLILIVGVSLPFILWYPLRKVGL
ncbi:hypothetical protein DVK06_13915 [Halorubrum sp. Atlit-28R]|nr:hypothetical protein DVK06_13915 [Halorubrum sp. Atlit-28R]